MMTWLIYSVESQTFFFISIQRRSKYHSETLLSFSPQGWWRKAVFYYLFPSNFESKKKESFRKLSIILPFVKQLKRKHLVSLSTFLPSVPKFISFYVDDICWCCNQINFFVLGLWIIVMCIKWSWSINKDWFLL